MNKHESNPSQQGFTLIEVLAVLLLLGLLGLVVTMNLQHLLPTYQLKSASRRITSILKLARSQSIIENHPYTITYDRQNRSVHIGPLQETTSFEKEEIPPRKSEQKMVEETFHFPEDIQLSQIESHEHADQRTDNSPKNSVRIRISPQGLFQPHAIHIRNHEGGKLVIVPNPATGEVNIRESSPTDQFIMQDNRR